MAALTPPPDFTVQVVTGPSQKPDPHATVICLDIDSFGSIAAAQAWAVQNQRENLFVSVNRIGGNMSLLSEYVQGVIGSPEDTSPDGWRTAAYLLWFAIQNPDFRDPPSNEPGAVSLEKFEEHLRAHNSGDWDDGSTC